MPKKVSLMGLCLAAAMLLSYVETLIPPLVAFPGIKAGLANIVVIFALWRFGFKEASLISFSRIILCTLIFGNFVSFWYSLCGATLSLIVMALLKKTEKFSVIGVSIAGGVMHNVGQILIAIFILGSRAVLSFLPALIIFGAVSGVAIGTLSALLIKKLEKTKFY
ncbi:MAG: Gx transporter family protein [Clostridia bacterium]|nr:Gx transporter family protein [Clostridia bacterium]